MLTEFLAGIAQQSMSLILTEIVFMLFIEKSGDGFKFRFSTIEEYPNLKPFANTFTIAIVAFLIYLFSPQIFEFFLGKTISSWLFSLGIFKLLELSIAFVGSTLLLFIVYTFEKKRTDKKIVLTAIITVIMFLLFFLT